MSFKKLFKPTGAKMIFLIILFLALGFLKIFTLQNAITGVVYENSLFQQYAFNYQHSNDSWYHGYDKFYWLYFLFLHMASSYVIVCIIAFVANRLRGEE